MAGAVDAQHRCRNPWAVREILETLLVIGEPEALDVIFQIVAIILEHETLDEALAFAVVDSIVALGGVPILADLYNYIHENIQNAAAEVTGIFLLAILDNALSQGEHAVAEEAQALCEEMGIA
jgi:hypothetical protein